MSWHHILGTPYLQASGLKQIARESAESFAWANDEEKRAMLSRLFGAPKFGTGNVIVLDGLPMGPVTVGSEITNSHYKPYYEEPLTQANHVLAPGDWFAPNPVVFPVAVRGSRFCFAVLPRGPSLDIARNDAVRVACWLREGLEILGAGAKTISAGLGRFSFS